MRQKLLPVLVLLETISPKTPTPPPQKKKHLYNIQGFSSVQTVMKIF